MRILHTVEFYPPSVGGAQEVVRQLSERLAARGHDVTVATTALPQRGATLLNGVRLAPFACAGNLATGLRGDVSRYREFLRAGKFDIILNYAAQQWTTDAAFELLPAIAACKILAPCGFSGLYHPTYAAYFRQLPEALKHYDHLILHSATTRDARFVREHSLTPWSVIGNGADAAAFATAPVPGFRERHGIASATPLLLTVGSHTGLKGHTATILALHRSRLPTATLVVIGNAEHGRGCTRRCRLLARLVRTLSRGRKRVLLIDPPRPEVVAAYFAADLFLFGSRLECSPLVLFEAMAAGLPFVSSAVGNAAEIAATGGGVILPTRVDAAGLGRISSRDMARAMDRLLAAPERRREMGRHARQTWSEHFTWDTIAGQYEQLYHTLAASKANAHI